MRRSGQLLRIVRRIGCPAVAIHGAYGPTPVEAVAAPSGATVRDFQMLVLERR